MTSIVLSAGKATRLNGMCKALVYVNGDRAVDRQTKVLGHKPFVVVRTEHAQDVRDAGYRPVICDSLGGPVRALKAAVGYVNNADQVTVLFADTMLRSLPDGSDWVGYSYAYGGREWDTVHLDTNGVFSARAWFPAGDYRPVAVGAYSFADVPALKEALRHVPDDGPFAWLLNAYPHGLSGERIHGWQDVGDLDAIARFEED